MTRFTQSYTQKLRDNADEAPVEEMLHDPIIKQLMDSDRVTEDSIVRLLAQIAAQKPYQNACDNA